MGRRGPSRSLFASLPPDLRNTIRTNGRALSQSGPDLDSLQVKQELLDALAEGSSSKLLRTQPPSESPERDIVEAQAVPGPSRMAVVAEERMEVDFGELEAEVPTESNILVKAHPVRPVKRRRTEGPWIIKAGPSTMKPVQKRRKGKELPVFNPYAGHPYDCTGLVERYVNWNHVPEDIRKYFSQRHLLFEEYDEMPLLLDHTGWFSVTAQPIARHIAERCRCDVIVDAFCGVGGNAIEFAKTCERDNDLTRLKLARHNALQYGVADRIEFIHGSYIDWAKAYASRADKEAIDVIFLSPPWGGVNYLTVSADPLPFPPTPLKSPPTSPTKTRQPITHKFPLSAILPIPGDELFQLSAAITPNIAYYLPRNVNLKEIGLLARRLDPVSQASGRREREWVEVEEEVVGGKVKAVTAYYGSLITDGDVSVVD